MRRWSLVLFGIGILAGLTLVALTTWAGQEAALFEPISSYDRGLPTLRCPLMITNEQNSSISVTLRNPSEYPASPLTTAHITSGSVLLIDEFREILPIPAGGKASLSWQIQPAEAAYKALILARVFVERSYPLPSRTGSCGVLVLPFGGVPGEAVAAALAFVSLLGMGLGLYFWRKTHSAPPSGQAGVFFGMVALAAILCAGFIAILFNLWLIGLGSVILVLLISIALASHYGGQV